MVSEQTILACERLRDDLTEFRKSLHARYRSAAQVTSEELRSSVSGLSETWLVEISTDKDVANVVGSNVLGDLNVHFQRMLTYAEHATTRKKYDIELLPILKAFTVSVVLALKQARGRPATNPPPAGNPPTIQSAFLGQSFSDADQQVNTFVQAMLEALGVKVVTGEKPKADAISEKVKRSIDEQAIFVGVFTRRDKIARKKEWTTSAWVIDEKAYAVGRQKPLVLLKELGVGSIGGIQGDYEYIDFSRDNLETIAVRLTQLFDLSNKGLRK